MTKLEDVSLWADNLKKDLTGKQAENLTPIELAQACHQVFGDLKVSSVVYYSLKPYFCRTSSLTEGIFIN